MAEPPAPANRGDEKRRQILAGAIRAFAAGGFYRTRVSDVAREAGVADGTIYLYFEGKDDLLAQIFERSLERFWERGEDYLLAGDSADQQLCRLIELHLRFMGEDRNLATVFQVDLRHSSHFLGDISRRIFRTHLERVAAIVARGQEEGLFETDLTALEAAKMIFGVLDQLVTAWVLSRRNYRLPSMAGPAQRFILGGLGCRRACAPESGNGSEEPG